MERSRINFFVDACLLLGGAALSGIGFIMKFVLPPGKERMLLYGRNVDLTLLGLDRHQWGAIHLVLAYILLGLLGLHLLLHLSWIASMLKRITGQSRGRVAAAVAFVLICLALFLLPFFTSPRVHDTGFERGPGKGMMGGRAR